jgi:hypothetical protein
MRIRDLFDPGSGMGKFGSGIRYEHPESATLVADPYPGSSAIFDSGIEGGKNSGSEIRDPG